MARFVPPRKRPARTRVAAPAPEASAPKPSPRLLTLARDKNELLIMALIFCFGAMLSVRFFGHQLVPNSDFPAFFKTGQSILSFEMPAGFKRLPLLGILQVLLSHITPGPCAELRAGWLLNALLYPFLGVFFYRIARRLVPRFAPFYALLMLVNPWMLGMLVQPIAEITLVFFFALTVDLLLSRSRWVYLAAALAALVRYEGVFLIAAAFLYDFIEYRLSKKLIRGFFFSCIAAAPVALWLLASRLTAKAGTISYVGHYGKGTCFTEFLNYVRQVSVGALFMTPEPASAAALNNTVLVVLALALLAAVAWSLWNKRWWIVPLLFFLLAYTAIHGLKVDTRDRYAIPVAWLVLLLSAYGLSCLGQALARLRRLPMPLVVLAQLITGMVFLVWAFILLPKIPALAALSPRALTVLWLAALTAVLLFILGTLRLGVAHLGTRSLLLTLTLFMLVSNQFTLARRLGTGDWDREFKLLADWYAQNADKDYRLLTTLPHVLSLFYPQYEDRFVHINDIAPDDPAGFLRACWEQKIRYIAWDSRLGYFPEDSYYKNWRLDRVKFLYNPQNVGPLEFIKRFDGPSTYRYINLFYLTAPPPPGGQNP